MPLGGGRDDGPTINSVFTECASEAIIVLDGYYSVNTLLLTESLNHVDILLSGTVQYTPDIAYWTTFWFLSGNDIHLYGGGTIDGNGQDSATAGASTLSFARPIPLTIGNSTNVVIENITQWQSPNWESTVAHISINSFSYSSAPAKNTDGWDIYRSSQVTITDSKINNGDDCVSLKPNATEVIVTNLWCNGSHGISVGSLGQYAGETDIVANVFVKNVTMRYAENGARIKVFGGSPDASSTAGGGTGYVKNVTFEDFYVYVVDDPIVIDQCYETDASTCAEYPSQLSISDIHYINVTGSSSGAEGTVVVDLECSQECEDITASGINITSPMGSPTYVCENVASEDELNFNCTAPSS
ncbi:glycoside hydrolase family 28 protein [Daedalea quercina L-15889]|uniref:galacturonan 1,4-alpha-galacturonidase n=1 Tax=Daedalea quercina L-15889 TaxID=1314783 RepID=A0A165SET9_9APHY|nr:glycoside hydrolase family 28 protein [Daedalea quercina L-15889]